MLSRAVQLARCLHSLASRCTNLAAPGLAVTTAAEAGCCLARRIGCFRPRLWSQAGVLLLFLLPASPPPLLPIPLFLLPFSQILLDPEPLRLGIIIHPSGCYLRSWQHLRYLEATKAMIASHHQHLSHLAIDLRLPQPQQVHLPLARPLIPPVRRFYCDLHQVVLKCRNPEHYFLSPLNARANQLSPQLAALKIRFRLDFYRG